MFLGRVVGPEDPLWSDEDQDKALAFEQEQARVCRGCGTRSEEWDPKQGGDRFAYVANHRYCPGCEVLHQEGRNIGEGREAYTYPYLEPREAVEQRERREQEAGP